MGKVVGDKVVPCNPTTATVSAGPAAAQANLDPKTTTLFTNLDDVSTLKANKDAAGNITITLVLKASDLP
jgi:hypothetical protein